MKNLTQNQNAYFISEKFKGTHMEKERKWPE